MGFAPLNPSYDFKISDVGLVEWSETHQEKDNEKSNHK
jgi:hypothetical protein